MEYHGIDFYFAEFLFLGESGTSILEDYYRNSPICGTPDCHFTNTTARLSSGNLQPEVHMEKLLA